MASNHQQMRRSLPSNTTLLSSAHSPNSLRGERKTAQVAPIQYSSQTPFQSAKLQTKHSTWTPLMHKPSNEQLYTERRDLIGHWFDMWTDLQRKRFLHYVLGRCKKNQIHFLNKFFSDNIPVTHADFTGYLPRFLSLYILSFLDPRSLSRASMVCWHWKFLTDQDTIWQPKCIRQGWFLPYTPKFNEYGAWKLHYIKCLQSLDVAHPSEKTEAYGRLSDGSRFFTEDEEYKRRKALEQRDADKNPSLIWRERPPWLDPDPRPEDMLKAHNSLISSANPKVDPSRSRGHLRSFTEPSEMEVTQRMRASRRRFHHRRSTTEGSLDVGSMTLSSVIAKEGCIDGASATMDQPWQSPKRTLYPKTSSGGDRSAFSGGRTVNAAFRNGQDTHMLTTDTRLVLLASNVPAYEILYASLKPGVECVCFDYDSTTIEALQALVEAALNGNQARSIAVVTRGLDEVHLVRNVNLSNESLENPALKHLLEVLSTLLLPQAKGAHLDFFAPLAATERGTELEASLARITGVPVCSPDVIGSDPYVHVCDGPWSSKPENDALPPFLYFDEQKLRIWQAEALRSLEAVKVCRENMERFYKNKKNSRLVRVTGEAVLESLQDANQDLVVKLIPALKEAVEVLNSQEKETVQPVQFIAEYLSSLTDRYVDRETPAEVAEGVESTTSAPIPHSSHHICSIGVTQAHPHLQPMDRKSCFRQIVSSEKSFVQVLDILHEVYAQKLRASLNSNKAITSLPNIQLMFADASTLRTIHRSFYGELQTRLAGWSSHQRVGDCFHRLQSNMKAYNNFHNNYPVILSTIDKCREQEPSFRAFLKHHSQTEETRMLTVQELFLVMSTRIEDYVRLLTHQEHCTPTDHKDRADLATVIKTFKDLQDKIYQNQRRGESERRLRSLQKKIMGCPTLLEANCHLIREEPVAHFREQSDSTDAGFFQHIQSLRLFLFNDALMVSIESKQHIPYTREVSTSLHFQAAVSLNKLKVQDIPDSRYASNLFALKTPKRRWLCSVPTQVEKVSWISILEETIRTAKTLE